MYKTFFGLNRQPFLFVPDVKSYFSVDFMEESRQALERAVQNGEGISLIFGTTGTGKTLLMQIMCQSLESEYTVACVSHCRLETPRALFLQLLHDLHVSHSGGETIALRLQLLDFARQEPTRGVVLFFDDAQHLSLEVLEEIRLLTDSADGSVPLFRVVLAGTAEFEEKLTLPILDAFNQRIASRCYLDSFSGEETSQYVVWQTDKLRIDPPHEVPIPLFTEEAKRRVHRLTEGIPRLINQLCGTALQIAAEQKAENVDEALIDKAWASVQHIETVVSETETVSSAVQESVISQDQIEEIIDRKRKTFQFRQFESVEFGTLTDSDQETVETKAHRSSSENEYKPPYPEDDDEYVEYEPEEEHRNFSAYRLQLHVPADVEDTKPANQNAGAITVPKRRLVPDFYKQERKFRRRYLLQKVQYRLGLFAGLLNKMESQQAAHCLHDSDMNAKLLQEYGAAVLKGRPPFVRKEPQHVYQTTEAVPRKGVTYPDPKTGVPIVLRWLPEDTPETDRFGIAYTEFLNRNVTSEHLHNKREENAQKPEKTNNSPTNDLPKITPPAAQVIRTSLNASQSSQSTLPHGAGLDESFDESYRVGSSAVSLAELFRANSSALQRTSESAEFKNLDEAIQRQLETVVQRLTKAAEKIEQAAEVSERAGQHVSRTAEFVEAEVKSALPTYIEMFRELSEFQRTISAELESSQQRETEQSKFRTFPRRQVVIERTVPTIDVELLLR